MNAELLLAHFNRISAAPEVLLKKLDAAEAEANQLRDQLKTILAEALLR